MGIFAVNLLVTNVSLGFWDIQAWRCAERSHSGSIEDHFSLCPSILRLDGEIVNPAARVGLRMLQL